MATIRRMSRTGKKPDILTQPQREHLLLGYSILDGVNFLPFRDEDHRRELYELHKDELLEITGPNKRCHAWWSYSAPEKRRQVIAGDESKCLWDRGLRFGEARFWEIADGLKHNEDPGRPVFESQAEYLKRHGLYDEVEK